MDTGARFSWVLFTLIRRKTNVNDVFDNKKIVSCQKVSDIFSRMQEAGAPSGTQQQKLL
jgi:hypothetical protein